MATIPLPALDVKTPQQPDLLGQYGKLIALQNAQQQNQMGNIQFQQAQRALGTQQATDSAFKDAMKIDPNTGQMTFDRDAVSKSLANAGYGSKIPDLMHSFNTLDKSSADLQKVRGEVQAQTTNYLGDLAYSLQKTAKNQDGTWNMDLVKANLSHAAADPTFGPKAQQLWQQVQQNPGSLDQLTQSVIAQSEKQRTLAAQELTAKGKGQQGDLAAITMQQKQVEQISSQLAQSKDDADYQSKLDALPRGIANKFPDKFDRTKVLQAGQTPEQITTTEQGAQKVALEGQQVGIARQRLAIANKDLQLKYFQNGFDNSGNPITADTASPVAKQIVAGNIDPATYRAQIRRNPGLMNQVLAIDPNFDETKIDKRFAFNKQLTNMQPSGIGGQSLALNTLVHHSDLLYDMVDGLNNGSFTPGNQLYNTVKTTFGAAPAPNFNTVRDFVVSEAAKLAHGGVPNESDITRSIESLKSASSPAQLKGGIDKILSIAGGKMQAINEQGQESGMGPNFNILRKEGAAIVQKHGIDPTTLKPVQQGGGAGGGITVQAPNGKTYNFKDQASADKFKKDAGIQ